MAAPKSRENLDSDYLPIGYNGHGICYDDWRNGEVAGPTGLGPNDKTDPVFGMTPDPDCYGGSDH